MSGSLMRAQRGVVLFIALIILVAMSLAGIALMRGVDTGTIIAGNLAFRQNTTFVGDLGVEAARAWLKSTATATLNSNQTVGGVSAYYADWLTNTDVLGSFDWNANSVSVTMAPFTPPAGYTVRYVIHRLCETAGDPTDPGVAATCMKSTSAVGGTSTSSKGAAGYGGYALSAPIAAMYRITVQVTGPRNARSYVQTTLF